MVEKNEVQDQGVYIVSADAKDLFLATYSHEEGGEYRIKYQGGASAGEYNTKRFINTLDYSLDLIKLRDVYEKVYRRRGFTFEKGGKTYSTSVINVTFKYSVKEFNRFAGNTYVKFGYLPGDVELKDGVCVRDGELIAVRVGEPVENPISKTVLGKHFCFNGDVYEVDKPFKSIITVGQLRERLYRDGFRCDGKTFRRFKRSSGSSRVGKCLFIDERLYSRMHRWEMCGLHVKEGQQVDLAALEAYIALTLSSIVDTIPLRPENFLVIDDYKSVFRDRAVVSRIGFDGWLQSRAEDVDVENSIWDGQSLIDRSAMGAYSNYGMILLRNRFFKSACFNTNIQTFFADYGITEVSQLNGFTLAERVEDIKIITTPSSIKYVKFGTLEKWLKLLEEDGAFGVVKHEKPPHFFGGRMVQAHYQLLNTLQLKQGEVDALVKPSLDYLRLIHENPAVLRYHVRFNAAAVEEDEEIRTQNDVVYQMLGVSDRFAETKMYASFRADIEKSYRSALQVGHILINGNYSTLLGNPVEMLLSAVGKFDGTSQIGVGNIHSKRFPHDMTILGSRSPHVTMGNILLTTNRRNPEIERYFNLTREIVCINAIGENILMRLSGADFDSDTMLLTDNPILIKAAEKNYSRFLVPTSMVEATKAVRHYTWAEQADLDIKTSVNKIGEIVNLSQELNTQLWHKINGGAAFEDVEELYCDIAKLDVLSGIEIDKAKKEFTVSSAGEIERMRQKYGIRDEDGRQVKPNFFGKVARKKGFYDAERKNYRFHDTTMDYLQHSINRFRLPRKKTEYLPFCELVKTAYHADCRGVTYRQVNALLDAAQTMHAQIKGVWGCEDLSAIQKRERVQEIRDEYSQRLAKMQMSTKTVYRLLRLLDDPCYQNTARSIFYMCFALPNRSFFDAIEQSRKPIGVLVEARNGNIMIHGRAYREEIVVPENCKTTA